MILSVITLPLLACQPVTKIFMAGMHDAAPNDIVIVADLDELVSSF